MIIAPSLLAADASCYLKEIQSVEMARTEFLHIDVMDGHFVPNLSFGPNIIQNLRPLSKMIFDVHLMIVNPSRYCSSFIKAGADSITIHAEVEENFIVMKTICDVNRVKFGLAVCPETSIQKIKKYLNIIDILLIMGIHPGFGGQAFMPLTLLRIKEAFDIRKKTEGKFLISVDGGRGYSGGGKCDFWKN